MAGGSSSSREQNFWPGFVDALTNVVLVMVFVIIVFAIVMFSTMLKVSKVKAQQTIEKTQEQQSAQVAALVSKAQAETQVEYMRAEQLQQENERLSAALSAAEQAVPASAPFAQGDPANPSRNVQPQAPVTLSGRSPTVNVSYALGVTTMEKKLIEALDAALGGFESAGQWQVSLQASMAEPSPSEARRLAFYRIAVLRDHLVSKGISPDHIKSVILNAPATDARSHVIIQIRK